MKSLTTLHFGAGKVGLAAKLLREGGVVAFPTETVYGLGANALDVAAVERIFWAKERPGWDPLIVHVCDRAMLGRVATVPGDAERLTEAFWPGPLTLLLPRTAAVQDRVTAGRELVGVRMPAHPLALALIGLAGVPVAAPSANRFGRTSPTTAAHVLADLDGRIDAVLDGGATQIGVESTVFDPVAGVVYRPGAVTMEMLSECLGRRVQVFAAPATVGTPESLPSPGMGLRHYAPRARLVLVEGGPDEFAARIVGIAAGLEGRVGVMLPDGWSTGGTSAVTAAVFAWGAWGDGDALAQRLFSGLRELDGMGVDVIVCPVPEMGGIGEALRDRLGKAARR